MGIVPTRMHHAGGLALVFRAGLFLNGQGIHVRSQRNRLSGFSPAEEPDHTGLGNVWLHLNT
jgi:hypothetical protein